MPKISYEKKIVLKLLAIKWAYILPFSKSWGVLESSKSRLFEFVKKNLTFQLFIMQIFAKFAKQPKIGHGFLDLSQKNR